MSLRLSPPAVGPQMGIVRTAVRGWNAVGCASITDRNPSARRTVDEREVMRAWRELFRGGEASSETLAEAEAMLEGLNGESPLHVRLANELEELKKLGASKQRARSPVKKRVRHGGS
jgi:hypothetical protein